MFEYVFNKSINSIQLLDEITTAGLNAPLYINTVADCVKIVYANQLIQADEDTLTQVVSNHVANFSYVPAAVQAEIDKLIGYLNNANTSVAATARSVMIKNLAAKLPPDLLTTVNTQIFNILGF